MKEEGILCGTCGRGMSIFEAVVYCSCDFRKKEFFCAFLKFAASSLEVAFWLLFQIVYGTAYS